MDSKEHLAPNYPAPTSNRPLLGLTILVVEDSRYASEAMRLLCLRSGARIRRADSLRAARKHLKMYQPSVVIVDLGLPDGTGSDLISDIYDASPRPEVILGASGDPGADDIAIAAGADGFLAKPIDSLGTFQEAILAHLPEDRRPLGPRSISTDAVDPDPIAYRDDMAHIADVLEEARSGSELDYVAQFLSGVANIANDNALVHAAQELARERARGHSARAQAATIAGLLQERLTNRMVI